MCSNCDDLKRQINALTKEKARLFALFTTPYAYKSGDTWIIEYKWTSDKAQQADKNMEDLTLYLVGQIKEEKDYFERYYLGKFHT